MGLWEEGISEQRGAYFSYNSLMISHKSGKGGGVSIFSIKQLCFKTYLEKHLLIHFILPCEVLSDRSCKGRKWEAPQSCCLWGMGQDKASCPQTGRSPVLRCNCSPFPALGMAGKTTTPSYVGPTLTLTPERQLKETVPKQTGSHSSDCE